MKQKLEEIRKKILQDLKDYYFKDHKPGWSDSVKSGARRQRFAASLNIKFECDWKRFKGSHNDLLKMKRGLEESKKDFYVKYKDEKRGLKGLGKIIDSHISTLNKEIKNIEKSSFSNMSKTIKKMEKSNIDYHKSNHYNTFQLAEFTTSKKLPSQTANHDLVL
ncbi:hypothetical protein [Piscirickettsia salmonis]|uniref:hypothetical protein n=1 Tax=Piscirickettsia salmonis TaxID=1238 RepID=UPI0007D7AC2D|nr:hypothetical protein A0O36_00386 [Piscirickettsiaceae bacterium NZ-RLO1]